ncbi:hypothetical protein PM082_011745 [Marasmius tenuissimus]|nr:hypothetical protein PM082_011745 [Marasmius tenuissimus]
MPGPEAVITMWCAMSISSGTLGLLMTLIAAVAAVTIYRFSRELPHGLHSPVVARDRAHDAGPLKGRMHSPTRARTALYGTTIAFGLPGTVIGIMHAMWSYEEKLQAFGGLASSLSTITWVWASVLLSYNRRPSITRTLTRASTHFYTLIGLAVLNFACGILILASTKHTPGVYGEGSTFTCDGIDFCWVHVADGAISLALTFPLTAAAVCIYRQITREGGKLSDSNVARFDGEGPETVNRDEILKLDP